MTKITLADWRTLVRIFEADGWVLDRQRGDHMVYIKPEFARPVVIPKYSEVHADIILGNMRSARMTRERYVKLLRKS